jgi:hypothetical protein
MTGRKIATGRAKKWGETFWANQGFAFDKLPVFSTLASIEFEWI